MKGKDFLSILDLSRQDLSDLLELSIQLKKEHKAHLRRTPLEGKTLALLFEKPSTRTLVSFDVAIYQLGGHSVDLPKSSLGGRESMADIARTLSRYVEGLIVRTYKQSTLEEIARYAEVPVINALSDRYHPCQILADYQTMVEHKGMRKIKIAYLGDGFNVANSLLGLASLVGYDISIATPKGYEPTQEDVDRAHELAQKSKSVISVSHNPYEAIQDADIIYTDTWTSMGLEEEIAIRIPLFSHFQINKELLKQAKPDTLVMHCLPAHRGQEITDEVMDGPQSIIFNQTENRLHMQKALLCKLFS